MRIWLAMSLLVGCIDARSGAGAKCSRNSECAAPLVCALQKCRVECNSSRDCPIGSSCVYSEAGVGVCQLDEETRCTGECPTGLTCTGGRCVNTCEEFGCPPGNECRDGACFDPTVGGRCNNDSECSGGQVCIGGRCLARCISDRDCRFGWTCIAGECRDRSFDAGARDADVPFDAEFGDAPALDVSFPDASTLCRASEVDVAQVCTGNGHACALLVDGTVWCWGDNRDGQLGTPEIPLAPHPGPVRALGMTTASRVECGSSHTCAIQGGELYCWGRNDHGQVGNGDLAIHPVRTPVRVGSFSDVRDVGLGDWSTCAIETETVWCWGEATNNSLGNGETSSMGADYDTPQLATDVPPAVALTRGRTLGGAVVTTAGRLFSWGQMPVPLVVPTFDDILAVDEGQGHLCVLRTGGAVWCAGSNTCGELGDDARGTFDGTFAVAVPGIAGAIGIEAGMRTSCAWFADGSARCWGNNDTSLPVGAPMCLPPTLALASGVTDVDTLFQFGCAVIDARVWCWGDAGGVYRLGNGAQTGEWVDPIPVECLP